MNRHLLVLVLFLSAAIASGQPLSKHAGIQINGFTDPGNVTYTYRTHPKTGEQIRQGTFRYIVKSKGEVHRFNLTIAGNYDNNLKDGLWDYKVNQKDFTLPESGRYTSGTISLNAAYSQGLPNDNWQYESALKSRSGKKLKDKWVWERHDSVKTTNINVHFKNGILIGSFYSKDDNFVEISGQFDQNGFFDGEWKWRYADSIVIIEWQKGVLIKKEVSDIEGNVLHLHSNKELYSQVKELSEAIAAKGPQAAKEFPFKVDTISLMQNQNFYISQLLSRTLIEPPYYMYQHIPGDKGVFYDKKAYKMRTSLKGMYQITLKSSLTSAELISYKTIDDIISRMESQMGYLYLMQREGLLQKQALEAFKLMEANISLARKYSCHANSIKFTNKFEQALNSAETGCSHISIKMDKLPQFKSRQEALQFFAKQIQQLEQENQKHYTNIRKNLSKK